MPRRLQFILTLAGALAAATALRGQQANTPHVAYVFPAGGRQGASFEVKVGGQYLANVTNAYISGAGVQAIVTDYDKPLTQAQLTQLREQQKTLQDKRAAAQAARNGGTPAPGPARAGANTTAPARLATNSAAPAAGQPRPTWTVADMTALAEIRDKLLLSQQKSANPVFAESVTLKITIAPDAEPGERELRLGAPAALSAPLVFCVGQLPEFNKPKPPLVLELPANRAGNPGPTAVAPVESRIVLPCVVNGQTMPGGVDRYRFQARQGQRLVIAAKARELDPYLADAVPGWFQATLSLSNALGKEVAYADHFRFHPDPVLYYEVPNDGEYTLQIRDSIYRGRDDFVYRITVGQVPFLTGIFPLGGPAGTQTTVQLTGWNLPAASLTQDARNLAPGVYSLAARTETNMSNHLPFAVDTWPECFSQEANHLQATAQAVTLPVIVNGRIAKPGQSDVFRFTGRAGDEIVAETMARRLDSPLDSVLKLTDADGKQLAYNDDFVDEGAGLQTHYADSYFRVTLPADGDYYLSVADAQQAGGPEYAYRLRLGPPRPDFALRVVPSSLAVRGGMSVPLTVHALRRDGFSNAITVTLKDAPAGFKLSGNTVQATQEIVRLSLTAPAQAEVGVVKLALEGKALIQGQQVVHPAVPAEDMMQAFAYRHLVPSQELDVAIMDRPPLKLTLIGPASMQIPAGGSAGVKVRTPGNQFTNNFQLELSAPPDGVSIESVSSVGTELEIRLHSDADKIKPGAKGNLIVNVFAKNVPPARSGAPARANQPRPAVGTLPAIPFEIVP
jgi:hypothetical protein